MIGVLLIILSQIITVILYILAKISINDTQTIWQYLTQISALLGSVLLSWSYILSIRNSTIEKLFGGLDKVYKVHNILGYLSLILLLNHPIFLIVGSLPYPTSTLYLIPSLTNLSYTMGMCSLYLLLVLLILTIFIDLPYKLWKKTHEFMGVVIIFGIIHSLLISSDVTVYPILKYWVLAFNILGLIAYIYKRFIYYLLIPKNNYKISDIIHDKDHLIITLVSTDLNKYLNFAPGQFGFFSLENDRRDEHPFSLLMQTVSELKIGVKVFGNFTQKLSSEQIGKSVSVYGPFGTFTETMKDANNMIWIAGGIGITPFYSALSLIRQDQNVVMYFSTHSTDSDYIANMFKEFAQTHINFKFIQKNTDIEGRLTEHEIATNNTIDNKTYVYICGPVPLMEYFADKLPSVGIKKKRIVYEDFNLK